MLGNQGADLLRAARVFKQMRALNIQIAVAAAGPQKMAGAHRVSTIKQLLQLVLIHAITSSPLL